jgi:hypothetical protein
MKNGANGLRRGVAFIFETGMDFKTIGGDALNIRQND